jgi:hypothetical protein
MKPPKDWKSYKLSELLNRDEGETCIGIIMKYPEPIKQVKMLKEYLMTIKDLKKRGVVPAYLAYVIHYYFHDKLNGNPNN